MAGSIRARFQFNVALRETILILIFTGVIVVPAVAQTPKWKTFLAEGDTLYKQEKISAAIKAYTKSIDAGKLKEKDCYSALYKRAICYYSIGEFNKALKDLQAFIPMFPEAPRPRLLQAFIYRELEDEDNQLNSLTEAIDLHLVNSDLLKWRGTLFFHKEDFINAKKDFLLARDLEDEAYVETFIGLCEYNLENLDSAFISFNKSIELDPMYIPAYLYAGSIALENGNSEWGLKYLNLALRLDPKNKEALFYKGAALVELDRVDEGCSCLNRAFYAGMDEAGDYLKEYCFVVED